MCVPHGRIFKPAHGSTKVRVNRQASPSTTGDYCCLQVNPLGSGWQGGEAGNAAVLPRIRDTSGMCAAYKVVQNTSSGRGKKAACLPASGRGKKSCPPAFLIICQSDCCLHSSASQSSSTSAAQMLPRITHSYACCLALQHCTIPPCPTSPPLRLRPHHQPPPQATAPPKLPSPAGPHRTKVHGHSWHALTQARAAAVTHCRPQPTGPPHWLGQPLASAHQLQPTTLASGL